MMRDEGLDKKLIQLLETGNKIDAIRLYYEEVGVGLKEAMQYVDNLNTRSSGSGNSPDESGLGKEVLNQIHRHLRAGSKTKALNVYIEATGAEAAEGKAYINDLYKTLQLPKKEEKEERKPTVKPVSIQYEEKRPAPPAPEVEEIAREIVPPAQQPQREYIPIEKERKQFSKYQRNGKTPLFLFIIIAALVTLFVILLLR